MEHVYKRDGRIVPFDRKKIIRAIESAMTRTDSMDESLATFVADRIEAMQDDLSVEQIQDLVERYLMDSDRKDVAKEYIIYRADRTKMREGRSPIIKAAWEKIDGSNVENANANVDEKTFGGRKNEASSVVQKEIALEFNMSPDIAEAHKNGYIYEHDMDHYNVGAHNCLFIDFDRILKNGFATRNGDVRPPKSYSTACQQYAVAFQIQSQCQYGGVASAHADRDLAPFVAMSFTKHFKDGMKYCEHELFGMVGGYLNGHETMVVGLSEDHRGTEYEISLENKDQLQTKFPHAWQYAIDMLEREGKQASQGLYHNLNTLESRAGSQVPFTSLNLGRDTTPEGRLVTRWILEASLEGIGKHHVTSIFPISIFSLKKGVNFYRTDPNYDLKRLALKSLSKRIYPNWAFGDWSEAHEDPNDPDTVFATMGCRTLVGYDVNGLGYSRVGRGNNNPITIILPKLGIEYGICTGKRDTADLDGFWNAFEDMLKLVERAHLERFKILARQSPKAAPFMYENGTIKDADKCIDNVEPALKHGTFAIGYVGIAEMCVALFGKNHAQDSRVHAFALRVVERINRFAKEATERNHLNFSCYATPAENLVYTAMKKLKGQYGIIPGVTEKDYLTNSHHVPVWEKVSIFDKLRLEAPFCKYPTGGVITYVECESTFVNNLDAIEDIIDYAANLDIPYLAINFPIDTCHDCGYQGEFDGVCPECGSDNVVSLRRVTGYLTADYRRFNPGKIAEVNDRVKHTAYTDLKE